MALTVYHWLNLDTFDCNCDHQNNKQASICKAHYDVCVIESHQKGKSIIHVLHKKIYMKYMMFYLQS